LLRGMIELPLAKRAKVLTLDMRRLTDVVERMIGCISTAAC